MFWGKLVHTSLLMASVCSVLCACQTRVTNFVVVPRPANQVVQRGPVSGRQTAIAGRTMQVDFSVSLNPDCSVRSIPTIHIIAEPAHGRAQLVNEVGYPHFQPNNIHAACDKVRVSGVALTYTPNPDYEGNDFLSFEIISDEGADMMFNDVITVKSVSPPDGGDSGDM